MRLGIIGRCDQRGIRYQSESYYRHLQPDKVLAVLMGEPGWPEDSSIFAESQVIEANSSLTRNLNARFLDEHKARRFLKGLDVVLAVETVYDWAFCEWAREEGVKVVVVGNPEFAAHHRNPSWPQPDLWVWPTPWMRNELVELGYGDTELPVPCEERDQTAADPYDDGPLKILHVAGKPAAGDRNGTGEFIEAVATIRQPAHVRIVTQDDSLPRNIRSHPTVDVEVITGGVADHYAMYEDRHLLVLPRRYGGLCLPAIEAMACGLTVMMPDCSPNEIWPGPRIKARKGRIQRSPFGRIETFAVHPIDVAAAIDGLAKNRDRLALHQDAAADWASYQSWAELKHRLYDPLLEGLT